MSSSCTYLTGKHHVHSLIKIAPFLRWSFAKNHPWIRKHRKTQMCDAENVQKQSESTLHTIKNVGRILVERWKSRKLEMIYLCKSSPEQQSWICLRNKALMCWFLQGRRVKRVKESFKWRIVKSERDHALEFLKEKKILYCSHMKNRRHLPEV